MAYCCDNLICGTQFWGVGIVCCDYEIESSFLFCYLFQGSRHSDVEENKDEDELLVNVPGSAYSISTASQERRNSELKTSASTVLGEAWHNDVLPSAESLPQS